MPWNGLSQKIKMVEKQQIHDLCGHQTFPGVMKQKQLFPKNR